jgi:hypothetical protein
MIMLTPTGSTFAREAAVDRFDHAVGTARCTTRSCCSIFLLVVVSVLPDGSEPTKLGGAYPSLGSVPSR